jgi:hypothetical protein
MTNEIETETTPVVVESGVRFPSAAPGGVETVVSATFLESGNQLQQVFIGLQPVLVIQPEYDAEKNVVDLVTIAVDLDPAGLVETLEVLLDAAKTMAAQQAEAIAEYLATDTADPAERVPLARLKESNPARWGNMCECGHTTHEHSASNVYGCYWCECSANA